MYDIPDWAGTILTGAGSGFIAWYFGRKKENADLQTLATSAWKDLSEKMEAREDKLQKEIDAMRVDFDAMKIELSALRIENAELRHRLRNYEKNIDLPNSKNNTLPPLT
jgi:predicted  nucleic acid-binding Zn-ribbon protein